MGAEISMGYLGDLGREAGRRPRRRWPNLSEHAGPGQWVCPGLVGAWPSSGLAQHFLEDCFNPSPGQGGRAFVSYN